MEYPKKQKLAVIKEAKFILRHHGTSHVCVALSQAAEYLGYGYCAGGPDSQIRTKLTEFLGKSQNGLPHVYESWVQEHHPEVYRRMNPDDFLQGRLQWLDWMAEEVKAGRL